MTKAGLSPHLAMDPIDPIGIAQRKSFSERVDGPSIHRKKFTKQAKERVTLALGERSRTAEKSIMPQEPIVETPPRRFSDPRRSVRTRAPCHPHPAAAADRTDAPSP